MGKAIKMKEQCPLEIGVNILSGKWKLQILWNLSERTMRFNEIQKNLGAITTKVLTQQLRELEDEGMIERKVYPEVPPKVEYKMTELGNMMAPVLEELCKWGKFYKQRKLD